MQTKGKSLEQIDLLFSGPKVLIDASEEELREMQKQEIKHALAEKRVKIGGDIEAVDQVAHIENVL